MWVVCTAYLAIAWVLLQVAMAVESTLELPGWVDQITLVLLAIGFPIALLVAWIRGGNSDLTVTDAPTTINKPILSILPFTGDFKESSSSCSTESIREDLASLLSHSEELTVNSLQEALQHADNKNHFSLQARLTDFSIKFSLLDSRTSQYLWADSYDFSQRESEQSLEKLLRRIAMQVNAEVARAVSLNVAGLSPSDMDSEACYTRGKALLLFQGWNAKNFLESSRLLKRAIALDPNYAQAHSMLALVLGLGNKFLYFPDKDNTEEQALMSGKVALELAPESSEVLGYVGCAYSDLGKHTMGIPILEKAIELDATNAQAYAALGASKLASKQVDAGVADLEQAIALLPSNIGNTIWKTVLGSGYLLQGKFDEAMLMIQNAIKDDVNYYPTWIAKALLHSLLEQNEEAEEAMAQALHIKPDLSKEEITSFAGYRSTTLLEQANLLPIPAEP